ncbi:MAG: DUF4153 domain-containing protein [Fibrobacter sp.]|nr:DUF4153 domain-containing protein [Fibrobacter sp.]
MDLTKIKQLPTKVSGVFKRFPVAMALISLATLYYIGLARIGFVHYESWISHHATFSLWMGFYPILGAILSVGVKLRDETRDSLGGTRTRVKSILLNVIPQIILAAVTAYVFKDFGRSYSEEEILIGRTVVLVVTTIALMFLIPSFRQKNDIPLWSHLGSAIKSFFASALIAILFYGILSALMLSLGLLFGSNIYKNEIYIDAAIFCASFIFPTLFLASLPRMTSTDEQPTQSKFVYGTIHYLFIPAVIFFVFVIYALSIKYSIMAGQIIAALSASALCSIASIIIICTLIYPSRFQENKLDSIVMKYLPWTALPLLLVSCTRIAILFGRHIQFFDTELLALYILHFWMLGALIILIVKKIQKKIWWTMVSLCATAIVATMFGINIFNLKTFVNPRYNDECEMCEYKEYLEEQALAGDVSDCDINDCTEASVDSVVAIPDTITEIEIRWDHETRNIPTEFPAGKNKIVFVDYRYIQDSLFILKNDTIHITLDLTEEDNGCASCGNAEENCADSTQAREQKDVREEFAIPLASLVDSANSDNAGTSRTAVVNHPVVYDNGNATLVIKKGTFNHSTASEYGSATISGALFLK